VISWTKGVKKVFDLGLGDTCERKFSEVYSVFAKTMLSARSPKSTKEVAKKLEDAQLRDEQTVRKSFCVAFDILRLPYLSIYLMKVGRTGDIMVLYNSQKALFCYVTTLSRPTGQHH